MKKLKITYKHIFFSLIIASLAGCKQPSFINLTSTNISQNPSGIYTLQTEVDIQDRLINRDSVKVSAVVGGESIPMVQDPLNPNLWSCDYKLPQGFDEATYYYQTTYNVISDNGSEYPSRVKKRTSSFSPRKPLCRQPCLLPWASWG